MIALVIVSTFVVLVLGILVAGLLRSHADILRSLHELGVGRRRPRLRHDDRAGCRPRRSPCLRPTAGAGPRARPRPWPASPRPGTPGPSRVTNSDGLTLLAFLSSGCAELRRLLGRAAGAGRARPARSRTRVVIVTKGPDREVPERGRVAHHRARPGGDVHRGLDRLRGPRLALLRARRRADGGRKVGSGRGQPRGAAGRAGPARRARPRPTTERPSAGAPDAGLGGPAREAAADDVLRRAGIQPGDPSLYPRTLEDVFPFAAGPPATAGAE